MRNFNRFQRTMARKLQNEKHTSFEDYVRFLMQEMDAQDAQEDSRKASGTARSESESGKRRSDTGGSRDSRKSRGVGSWKLSNAVMARCLWLSERFGVESGDSRKSR